MQNELVQERGHATAAAVAAIEPAPADIDQPLTEADFTDCIKLEDIIGNIPTEETPAVLAKIGQDSTEVATTAAQPKPVAPESTEAAPIPETSSDLYIRPFGNLAISEAPVEPLRPAPTEAEFRALEKKLTKISGRPFTIGRSANIHDPTTVAYVEDHALSIQNQLSMARAREAHFNQVCRTTWPHGP